MCSAISWCNELETYFVNHTVQRRIFAKTSIESRAYLNNDYISNYSGTTKGKQFLSSTLYIKNNGKLIGMFCCNRDTSIIADLENAIKRTAHQYNLIIRSHDLHENLEERHDSIVADAIAEVIENNGGIAMLKTADKIQVVGELSKKRNSYHERSCK